MEASKQLESSDLRLSCHSESFAGCAYTSSNSDCDGDSIAEPYLYEPDVQQPRHSLWSPTMMKGSTTPSGEAKASICSSLVAYQISVMLG